MHPVIAAGLAAELDRLASVVRSDWSWPSPAAGFAWWLLARHGDPALVARPETTDLATGNGRLGEAPVLAAYGYLLSTHDEPEHELIEAWSTAATRLRDRDALPGDRASFFFRPIELLGLALGSAAVTEHDPQPRKWLRQTLRDGRSRLGTDTWSVVLNTLAAVTLGDTTATGRIGPLTDATAIDLAAMWLMSTHAPQAAEGIGLDQSAAALESGLLYRVTSTITSPADTAEAAATYAATASAIGTSLARPDYGLPAALNTVIGVLRRFPAIVRELAKRHAGRPSLVAINDEYDVQDLLRGVLRGLFDDVRDEETTPSHAGVRSRMDLLLKREQIVIETKMTRANLDQRGVAQELAIDKELYRSHPDCRALVCFVYNPTLRLANPTALEDDLTDRTGPMPTIVIVAPLI